MVKGKEDTGTGTGEILLLIVKGSIAERTDEIMTEPDEIIEEV